VCTKVYVTVRVKITSFQNFWSTGMRVGITLCITVGLCDSGHLQWHGSMQRAMWQDLKRTNRFSSPKTGDSEGLVTELNFGPRSKAHSFKFNVQGSVHRKYIHFGIFPTRYNITQFIYLWKNCSTCFGWYLHASLGAHTTVFTVSGKYQTL